MKTLLLIFLTVFSTLSWAMPDQVILLRHGEEPKGEEGTELSKKGRARARNLHEIFDTYPDLKKPSALFAMKPKSKHGSIRSIQTLEPMSVRENLELRIPYQFDQYHMLITALKTDRSLDGKSVMIAWGHDELEAFAEAFGARGVKKWDGKVFNKLWILTFKNGEFQRLEERDQNLSSDRKSDRKDDQGDEDDDDDGKGKGQRHGKKDD